MVISACTVKMMTWMFNLKNRKIKKDEEIKKINKNKEIKKFLNQKNRKNEI